VLGSTFVQAYAPRGYLAWEAAAVAMAQAGGQDFAPWGWVDLTLSDDAGNTATLQVMADVLAIGTAENHVRLPLRPGPAQSVCNVFGWMLPTPWLVYQIWRSATRKCTPHAMVPNLGAKLDQYAAHSNLVDQEVAQLAASSSPLPAGGGQRAAGSFAPALVAGAKKHVVVSNAYKPASVVIFGWYKPSPPAPDVFDQDHIQHPWDDPDRQPVQVLSNAHGDFYVDYSHGIQPVQGTCTVNGQTMRTDALYQDPKLCHLVSNEGPVRVVRYPATVPPATPRPPDQYTKPAPLPLIVSTTPDVGERIARR